MQEALATVLTWLTKMTFSRVWPSITFRTQSRHSPKHGQRRKRVGDGLAFQEAAHLLSS